MLWHLAGSALRHRPLRTFLTALGIAVAVGSTVVFLSLGEGMRRIWTEEIGGLGPDLQVSYGPFDASSLTTMPEVTLDNVERLEAVRDTYGITGLTPLLFHVRGGLDPSRSFVFQGWPPATDLQELYGEVDVVAGRPLSAADGDSYVALIGARAAERNRLEVGDELRLNPRSTFTIVGIANASGGILDNAILVPLRARQ